MNRLLFLICFLSTLAVCAQQNAPVIIELGNSQIDRQEAIPFSAFKIIDARFDRSNIGTVENYLVVNKLKHHKTAASFPDSLHLYLPVVFNKIASFDKANKDTLAVLIKQFRIVDYSLNSFNLQHQPKILVKISASFFKLNNNQLTKMFSVDDLVERQWHNERRLTKKLIPEFREDAIMSVLQSLLANRKWSADGASFPMAAVYESIEKRFQLPVFSDTLIRAGVYKTFKEFKNNSPSVTNVKFLLKKSGIEVQDLDGQKIDLKGYWGASNGKSRFILFRGELRELVPSDKSFTFYSYSQTSDLSGQPGFGDYAPQTGILPALLIKASDNQVAWHNFYLNMDEEEVYLEEVFGTSSLKTMQKDLLK